MDLLIKGSTELNKMFMALQRTASGLRHDFGEVESLQQSLRGAKDFVQKACDLPLFGLPEACPGPQGNTPGLSGLNFGLSHGGQCLDAHNACVAGST